MPKNKSFLQRIFLDKDFKELFKESSIAFILRIAGIGCTYALAILITRNYGSATYGQYSFFQALINLFTILGLFGLDYLAVRYIAEFNHEKKSREIKYFFWQGLLIISCISIVVIAGLLLFKEPLAKIFKEDEVFIYYLAIAGLPLVLTRFITQAFRGLKKIAIFSVFKHILIPLLAAILILIPFQHSDVFNIGIWAYFWACIISMVLVLGLWLYNTQKLPNPENILVNARKFKNSELLVISFPFILASSMVFLNSWVDHFFIKYYWSNSDLGIYNICVRIVQLTLIPLIAVNAFLAPKFSELYSSGAMEAFRKIVHKGTGLIIFISFPILVIIAIFPTLLLSFFGEDFTSGYIALRILLIGQVFNIFLGPTANVLKMTDNQKTFQNIILTSLLINIVLNFVLVPDYGIIGASISNSISVSTLNLGCYFMIWKKFNFSTIPIYISKKLFNKK